jgi:hypothetical protein
MENKIWNGMPKEESKDGNKNNQKNFGTKRPKAAPVLKEVAGISYATKWKDPLDGRAICLE